MKCMFVRARATSAPRKWCCVLAVRRKPADVLTILRSLAAEERGLNAQHQSSSFNEELIRELPDQLRALRHDPLTYQILEVGLAVYTPHGLTAFLTTRQPEFGGQTGLQLVERGQAERVLAALAADLDGLGY
jgi:hypothetical protein